MKMLFLERKARAILMTITLMGCVGCGGSTQTVSYPVWVSDPIAGLPSKAIPINTQFTVEPAENVLPITVGATNKFLVSLTVCIPGSDVCQKVDKIMVDTGSVGLRIHTSVLPVLQGQLPAQQQIGGLIAQCATFGNFYTWGSIRTADVSFGGRKAIAVPFQEYDDPALPIVSATNCGAQIGGLQNADPVVVQFNGILGIRGMRVDPQTSFFVCQNSDISCQGTVLTNSQKLPNPLLNLSQENNGYQIVMSGIPDGGSAQVTGALILGINTQSNNISPQTSGSSPQMLALDDMQRFALYAAGVSYGALMDSGTSVNTLPTTDAQTCGASAPQAYCPSSVVMQTIQLAAASKPDCIFETNLSIGNWLTLLATGFPAINNIASRTPSTVKSAGVQAILGAPFFYGRRISFSIDGEPVRLPNKTVNSNFILFE